MLQAVDEARSLRLDQDTSAILRAQAHQSDSPRSHRDHSDSEAAGELEPDDEDALEPGGSACLNVTPATRHCDWQRAQLHPLHARSSTQGGGHHGAPSPAQRVACRL